jgi:ribosomal protein L7/L12
MRRSNKIWRVRNKVKNGEWDDLSYIEMTEQIEDYIAQNQKINAIKYYRSEMKDRFDEEVGLREAKDYVDQIHHDMKRRGVISR